MRDLVRLAVFCGFAGLGAAVAVASWRRAARATRLAANSFIAYAMVVSFTCGILQREMWPFSTWPLVAGIHPDTAQLPYLTVVDAGGGDHGVDYRVWEPLIIEELMAFANNRMQTMPVATRNEAAEFLLVRVEQRIQQVRDGGSPGVLHGTLGPFTAPSFLLHPATWNGPNDLPPLPLTGLRLYRERWKLDERHRDPTAVERTMVYEYLRR